MVMGYVGKMFVSQKTDASGLASLLTDQSVCNGIITGRSQFHKAIYRGGINSGKWRYRRFPEKNFGL